MLVWSNYVVTQTLVTMIFCLTEESEFDEMEQYETAVSTSGYAVGKRLLNLGLYGMDKDKMESTQKDAASPDLSEVPAPTAAEIAARKKKKKVNFTFFRIY